MVVSPGQPTEDLHLDEEGGSLPLLDEAVEAKNELHLELTDIKRPKNQGHELKDTTSTFSSIYEDESTEEADIRESLKEDSKRKVPDGGYGWFVVLGCFLSHLFIGGLDRCDAIFYFLFKAKFHRSAQLTVWPGALAFMLTLVTAPVANAASTRYSVRSVVMVGGILVSSACLLTSIAPNFYFMFLTHGLLGGIGRGLTYAPGLVLVGMYFDKRVGLAVGLGTSGVGIGTFLIVPLAQKLSETYGFFGTFLIVAGLTLHTLLVAMLYRPLSMTYKFSNIGKQDRAESVFKRARKSSIAGVFGSSSSLTQKRKQIVSRNLPDGTPLNPACNVTTPEKTQGHKKDNCFKSSLKIVFPVDHSNKKPKSLKDLFNFRLLKNPSFLMYCVSIGVFSLTFKAAFTFIPALVKSKGIPESDSALVLSVAGIMDTIGRIVTGLVLDTGRLRPLRPALYNLFLFGLAGIAFLLPSLHSFASFAVVCGLFGFITGSYISQKSVILLDILEPQHMSSSLGILLVFQGLGNLVGPPISGALKDYFGGFDEAFYLGGCLAALSGLVMVISNIFLRIQRRKHRERMDLGVRSMTESTGA